MILLYQVPGTWQVLGWARFLSIPAQIFMRVPAEITPGHEGELYKNTHTTAKGSQSEG